MIYDISPLEGIIRKLSKDLHLHWLSCSNLLMVENKTNLKNRLKKRTRAVFDQVMPQTEHTSASQWIPLLRIDFLWALTEPFFACNQNKIA